MRRLRVALDCRVVSPKLDGLSRYTLGLAQAFLRGIGEIDLQLVVPRDLPFDHPLRLLIRDTDAPVIPTAARLFSMSAHVAVPMAIRRARVDVYHYPHFNMPLAAMGPTVATIHDLTPLTEKSYFGVGAAAAAKRAYFHLATSHTIRRARVVIAPSEATAREIRARFGAPVSIVAVAEGVDSSFQIPTESDIAAFRKRHALGRPYLLYVGVRRPHKNLPRLVRAFARVAADVPHDLVLVGSRPAGGDEIGELASDLSVSERVRSLGYLPDPELPLAYAGSDAFVLCSTAEGFGLGILESFRSGTAVVTSSTGATAEVAGDATVLVDPLSVESIASGLRAICLEPELRRGLRARGLQRAAHFTWERAARSTADAYRSALE